MYKTLPSAQPQLELGGFGTPYDPRTHSRSTAQADKPLPLDWIPASSALLDGLSISAAIRIKGTRNPTWPFDPIMHTANPKAVYCSLRRFSESRWPISPMNSVDFLYPCSSIASWRPGQLDRRACRQPAPDPSSAARPQKTPTPRIE